MGQRFGDNYLAQAEQPMESGVRGREVPRRVHNTAVRSTGACAICWENHRTQECPTFRNADHTRRNELVKEHRLCFCCLRPGHRFRFCKSKRVCGVDGCTRSHHRDMHERVAPRVNHLRNVQGEAITTEYENRVHINTWKQGNSGIALGVVAVQVKDARGRTVNVWTMSKLWATVTPFNWEAVQDKHLHLTNLDIKVPPGPIDLLIGMDHAELLMPSEIRPSV